MPYQYIVKLDELLKDWLESLGIIVLELSSSAAIEITVTTATQLTATQKNNLRKVFPIFTETVM